MHVCVQYYIVHVVDVVLRLLQEMGSGHANKKGRRKKKKKKAKPVKEDPAPPPTDEVYFSSFLSALYMYIDLHVHVHIKTVLYSLTGQR